MLEKLTKEQEKTMEEVSEFWLHFINDNKLDQKKAREKIEWLYQLSGFKKPKVKFLASPMALQVEANKLMGNKKKKQFYAFSWYGNIWDYGWVAFYDFFTKIGMINFELFNCFKDLILSGIYDTIQFDKICLVCGKPDKIFFDDKDRLHSLKEPAISWKDGFSIYFLHGVRFDQELWQKIISKDICAKDILTLKNMEQRYVAMKIIGAEKLFKEFKTELLDESKRNKLYIIYDLIPNKPQKLLNYKDPSTERWYWKFVPPDIQFADQGQAWSYQITKEEYDTLKEEA